VLSIAQTVFKILTVGIGIHLLVWGGSVCASAAEFGVVSADKLNVRSGPDRTAPSIIVLTQGTRVRVLKHLDGWLEIYHDGKTGFIRNRDRYVRIVEDTQEKPAKSKGQGPRPDAVKQESKDILREIEQRSAEVKAFTREETTLINGLDEIDLSLSKAQKRISELRSDMAALEGQITETAQTVKALLKSIETSESYVSKRLVALYKMHVLGRMQILASADSMNDFFLRKSALERILAYDEAVQKDLLEKKALLGKLLDRLNAKKADRVALEDNHRRQIQFMSRERSKRSRLLEDIRSRKSLELAAIESLKAAAAALEQTIRSLESAQIPHAPVNKKPLQKSFSALKGLLKMPVNGRVTSRFGTYTIPRYQSKGFLSGIYIEADRGEPIRAVSGGHVIYSGWFKGYGNMIILDHGEKYYTVYAHAQELFKTKGDSVENQEVIATVGDMGSLSGPRLYFELRHLGKPVDPLPWMNHG